MRQFVRAAVGLALVALALGGTWFAVRSVVRWFDGLAQDTAVAVVGAGAVLTVPLVTYLTNRTLEQRRAVEAATRAKRVQLYEEFFEFFGRMFTPEEASARPTSAEMMSFLVQMTPRMMAHASNDVVKRWGRLRVASTARPLQPGDPTLMYEFEDLMKAMRTDLGHSSLGIQRHDILRLFINDIDQFKARLKQT